MSRDDATAARPGSSQGDGATGLPDGPSVRLDVVVCAHDERRLPLLRECVAAITAGLGPGDALYIVCDHAPAVAAGIAADPGVHDAAAEVSVLDNAGEPGLAAARNTGTAAGSNPVVCFIDDDAVPRPGWADAVRDAFRDSDDGRVVAIGGAIHARHVDDHGRTITAPSWLPAEHGWIIGCDYAGLPGDGGEIRNPIGAAMAIRRGALEAAGGFDETLGRVGADTAGAEETEMLLRIRSLIPDARVLRVTDFAVDHAVPPARRTIGYHLRRAFGEGRSKARLASAPHGDVSSESGHLTGTIPRSILHGLAGPVRRDAAGPARAALSAGVVAAAGLGFLTGRTGAALPGANPAENRATAPAAPSASTVLAAPAAPSAPGAFTGHENPEVSVVLCTDGRGPHLPQSIAALLAEPADTVPMELVIVDNSTSGDLHERGDVLAAITDDPRTRIVRAPVRGLSRARNVGIAAARGALISFTDDDTIVDPGWAAELAAGFRASDGADDPAIWCVTGRTTAYDLDTDVHRWFEEAISFDKGPVPRRWTRRGGLPAANADEAERADGDVVVKPPLYPWPAGCFGSGNNMAFRASAFRRIGGFAEELGAGRITRGGEDLDMFRLVILSGGDIVYRPSAAARHHHRDSLPALRGQMFGYGSGMAASLARCALDDPRHAFAIIRRIPSGLRQLVHLRTGGTAAADHADETTGSSYPTSLLRTELMGYLLGVPLLVAARAADAAGTFGIGESGSPTTDEEVRR